MTCSSIFKYYCTVKHGVKMMKMSRLGILVLIILTLLASTGCVGRVMARKDIVDGAKAYKDRKFDEAEKLFRTALQWDSSQKVAEVFLARTLHSQFANDRKNIAKAEDAIAAYKKVLADDPKDESSFKAVANLLDTLQKPDELKDWLEKRSADLAVPPEQRAEAFTLLAAKHYSCANDITDQEPVKKTVIKGGGKAEFVFSKPAVAADFEKLKGCIASGTELIDKALALETDEAKNAKSKDIKSLNDVDLAGFGNRIKKFESTRSYETSLLIQNARLAEMESKSTEKDSFKQKSDEAKAKFVELAEVGKNIVAEQDARAKAKSQEEEKK
jgi:tetratricopeptide (TPR) repeat protein